MTSVKNTQFVYTQSIAVINNIIQLRASASKANSQ